jgi:glutamate-1-semialdehyde 2,1-aminomutase
VRELCDATGTLLILDETHTFSAGPGGATRRFGLKPDALTIGKSLGGGVACGAYGLSEALADRILSSLANGADIVDVGGIGGTLAGNAMSLAAMRAVLGEVLADEAFGPMEQLASAFAAGVEDVIDRYELAWSVGQLGERCEYRFASPAPVNGGASARSADAMLEDYLHLSLVNRGVLLTPFHNMALTCPATTLAQVERHQSVFEDAVATLFT